MVQDTWATMPGSPGKVGLPSAVSFIIIRTLLPTEMDTEAKRGDHDRQQIGL